MSGIRMRMRSVRNMSAYARPESHLVEQTVHGAFVSVIGVAVALILLANELGEAFWSKPVQEMSVDLDRTEYLPLTINLTLPKLPCAVISVDQADVSGHQEIDVGGGQSRGGNQIHVHKFRLDSLGRRMSNKEFKGQRVDPFAQLAVLSSGGRIMDKHTEQMMEEMSAHEGCNIYGTVDIRKMAGTLHFSIHTQDFLMLAANQHHMLKDLIAADMEARAKVLETIKDDLHSVNISHTIHKLAFGPEYPHQVNPLDNLLRIVDFDSGTFRYFLKIVPTEFYGLFGRKILTNQYSVQEYYSNIMKGDEAMPAIYFMYDLSPIKVTVRGGGKSLLSFLVRLCAVVGGCFAVTGMIDRWVHRIMKVVKGAFQERPAG